MKAGKLFILTLLIAFISSCSKNDEVELNKTDYLIFGHFYGECIGTTCVETYKLTNTKLYEDTNGNYLGTEFNFVELGNDKFHLTKDLIDYFPNQLLNENENVFGCPDCVDQGGLFIQYSKNENVKSWRIDQSKNAVPNYLHSFMDKVNEKIYLINN